MTAHDVFSMILQAADRQIDTTPEGKAITAAGLKHELRALVTAIAANAANPIETAFDEHRSDS